MLEAEHLPIHVQELSGFEPQKGFMASKSLAIEQFEWQAFGQHLPEAKGNVSRATTLVNRPEEHSIASWQSTNSPI